MKRFSRFSLFALILALGLSFSVPEAEARRLGGGLSSGMKRDGGFMQRSNSATPAQTPSQAANTPRSAQSASATPPQAAPQPSGMRRWLGPLAGLAAGVGLAALFSHLGMGAEMGSFLLLLLGGVAVFLGIRWLMNRQSQPAMQPALAAGQGGNVRHFEPVSMPAGSTASPDHSTARPASIPAGFDADGFLRQAKLNFIRLQAANDSGNMDDIRAFTAPELYAEIQMQYQERGKAQQQTDVAQLDAALLDVAQEGSQQIASVRFSGLISEAAGGAPEHFEEIWHLTRPTDGRTGWVVAGIEQPH